VINFGEADAITEDEKNRVYNEGVIAAEEREDCYDKGVKDAYQRLPIDPETVPIYNPYQAYPDPGYKATFDYGFSTGCTEKYLSAYANSLDSVAQDDARKSEKESRSFGFDESAAGNPREPEKFCIQLLNNQKFYVLLIDSSMKKQYENGWMHKCSGYYIDGYDKVKTDEALARETGKLFDINETQVVEYFGGEEGVEQAYRENCVIATASYGSPMAKEVQMLREIRDNQLLQTQSGSAFMSGFNTVYYSFAPTIAQWEQENPAFKEIVKTAITPLITSLSLLNHVSMDSEAEVLGYGISLILLNIGMYFAIPATVVWQVNKRI